MSIRLNEYVSTINKRFSLIVSRLVLPILIALTITSKQVTVHGQFNESLTTINNLNNETLINTVEVTTSKPSTTGSPTISSSGSDDQQQLTTPRLDSYYYHVTVSPDEQLDDVNTQQSTLITVDVPPVIRSEQQQLSNLNNTNNNNQSSPEHQTIYKSPEMPGLPNSTLIHQNNSLIGTNQSTITVCDPNRYTFDHQQVAKFFLTTMILLGFCCLLIVILLVLVTYIYRKLSKGRNVKVSSRGDNGASIEIDTIKDGRFYPIQDNPAFDEDEFVGTRTDFRFFEVSSLPYNRNQFNHHQGNKSLTTDTFGYRH